VDTHISVTGSTMCARYARSQLQTLPTARRIEAGIVGP
jgi:hypothetical protein